MTLPVLATQRRYHMKLIPHCVSAIIVFLAFIVNVPNSQAQAQANDAITLSHATEAKSLTLSLKAIANLTLLRRVLEDIGMAQHTKTLQAIMLVETRAGDGGSVGLPKAHWTRRSYGLMQLTLPTARIMLQRNPDVAQKYFNDTPISKISNSQLIKFLINNKEANIHLGAIVYNLYLGMVNGEWARAVAAYNMGIGNALKRSFAPKVQYVKLVKMMMGYTYVEPTTTPTNIPTPPITEEREPLLWPTKEEDENLIVDIFDITDDHITIKEEITNGEIPETEVTINDAS